MKPEELEDLQAAVAAYVPNIPEAPIEEPTKFNEAMPHLLPEAIMVDLLAKNTVFKTDLPEHLQPYWDQFFHRLKPQCVGKVRFHEFYNYLIDVL